MRTRLLAILTTLMACAVVALGVPLARSLAESRQQMVFFDRSGDTARFAGMAGQAGSPGLDTTAVLDELTRYDEVYGISAAIVDRSRQVRVASRPTFDPLDPDLDDEVSAALRGRRGENPPLVWPWQDDRSLVVAEPVLSGGDVVGAAVTISPTDRLRADVGRQWLVLGVVLLVSLLLCAVVAVRLTRWVLQPVLHLDTVTHEIATGRLSARVSARIGPPELRRLTVSFNDMADHVEQAISRQRDFVADASHQLRNPLSALLLRIENIGLGLPPEWLDELDETRAEGRRLTEVLDELLALARAEHHAPNPAEFDAVRLVAERLAAWQLVGESRQISVRREGPASVPAFADRTALGSALDAVLDNALKFSPAGSTVEVTVAVAARTVAARTVAVRTVAGKTVAGKTSDGESDGGGPGGGGPGGGVPCTEVRVSDHGPGVEPDELTKVGRRFWRSAANVNIGGSGLGLAIASSLLTASGGGLSFALREPHGLAVTLWVPSRPPSAEAVAGQDLTSR